MSWKLRQKGIALVCLPLCFQVVFLIVLINALSNADAALQRESTSKYLIYTASNVLRHSIDCATAGAMYNFTHQQSARDKSVLSMQLMKQGYEEISQKSSSDKGQADRIAACKETIASAENALNRLLNKIDDYSEGMKVFANNSGLSSEKRLLDDISRRTSDFIEAERILCDSFTGQLRRARQNVVVILVVGIGLNIVIAIGAAVFFFQNIATRIERLKKSTDLISGKKTSPINRQGDEILQLDLAFQQAITDLHESEEMRRQLVAMVGHDLRSPLTSIDAALTLISEGAAGEVSDEAKTITRNASLDIGRLVRLTNDLLDAEQLVSGSISLKPTSVSARKLIADAIRAMEFSSINYSVAIEQKLENDFQFSADSNRLNQVLCNLIGNAIKFSPHGSKIVVDASENGDKVEFTVVDTGCGIAVEHQNAIFDSFVKIGDHSNSGKGLGLAICKALVELHGGQIGVESVPGQGSAFWFRVPKK
ncbi:MAG: HAMP domain-containing histidine kinase [Candidatus Obscuribacterales bacterium]|nr:HAMP domain-containing histidine kinase [Candidatus Obscuribacterales bacterium]